MGLIDRIFVGEVLREWELEKKSYGIAWTKTSLIVARRRRKLKLVIRHSGGSFLGGGVVYTEIPSEAIQKFRQSVEEALQLIQAQPTG